MTAPSELLTYQSWPDVEWDPADKPIVVAEGRSRALSDLDAPVEVSAAYVVGINEKTFPRLCELVRTPSLHFYEMRVGDLSPLADHSELRHLSIRWNTKMSDLETIGTLSSLQTLLLEDTPKVSDLTPLTSLPNLAALVYQGGIWNKNRARSLEPLTLLPKLEELHLLNARVDEGGLVPLADCSSLRTLVLSNQFATEDYAFLSVRLPHVDCEMFAPFVRLAHPIEGKDIMVVGRRKPFLNSQQDAERLTRYVQKFGKLQRQHADG